jgi:hypothetical protein
MMAPSGGECRSGDLFASVDFSDNPGCADPWGGGAVAEVQGFDEGMPRALPSQVRIRAVAGLPSALARTLDATTTYDALKLVFRSTHSAPPNNCSGCESAACLVLNSILVRRLFGAPGGDIQLTPPGQAGEPRHLAGRRRGLRWRPRGDDVGEIKSLYRQA